MNDLRFAFRQLRQSPGFTTVAVLTLALGIGANTAMFSIINGVLLRPLPYPQPQQLVTLWERDPKRGIEQDRVSGPDYLDWRAQSTVLSDLAACPGWSGVEDFNLVLQDTTVKITATYTSASLFSTLGVQPWLGRGLLAEEDVKGASRVAVLSHGLWQRSFAGDSNVLGRTITLDTYGRRDYTVVGVMPPGFGLPGRCELWLPLGWMGVTLDSRRSAHWHNVVVRLKPGVTLAQAQRELSTIQAGLRRDYPGETIGSEVAVIPLVEQALGSNLHTGLLILWGVVAGVLLIACANVANLMLARAGRRQKEMALRLALGAGRWRVLRQLLTESVVLALVGGTLGTLLGWGGLQLFRAVCPENVPRLDTVRLDGLALAFTSGLSLLTGLAFGLAPAWQLSRASLDEVLKEGGRGASSGSAAHRTRSLLVVSEVALSVVLLAGAGLMLQSFARMLQAERGFVQARLVTAELDFSVSGFTTWVRPTATRPQVPLQALMDRLRALPGVQAVGAGSRLLRRDNQPPQETFSVLGRERLPVAEQPRAEFKGVSPDWVRALGVRLLRGRDFAESDQLNAPGAVLVNETLARRHFPEQDPVGQYLKMGSSQPPLGATNNWGISEWSQIIGVVSDVKSLHPRPEAVPEIYQSYWQFPMQNPTLLIRTTGDPVGLASAIRRETKRLIPNLPPPVVRTMDELVSQTVAQPRLQAGLLGLFAGVALLLTAIGLYGVLACIVTQRHREIGIRLALGAPRRKVLWLILGQGLALTLAGVGLGTGAALALTRLLSALLYEVRPTDAPTFAAVSLLLGAVALLACWLPARRAATINPVEALRYE